MNILKNCSNAYKVCVGSGITLFKYSLFISIPLVTGLLASCADGRESRNYMEASKAVADSVSNFVPGIATDTINGITHNFIRTADLKCKVKDVLQSTKQVEQIAGSVGGYVTQSDLNSNKDYNDHIHFKKDSTLERTHYTSVSNITLRVPNKLLDSVLCKITDMAVFVDFRHISSNDVKMKLFANQLAERRFKQYKTRLQKTIDKKDAKLNQVTNAEESALEKQSLADDKRVEAYDLADQVNYATVVLSIYQEQNTFSTVKALPTSVEVYEPSFISKLGESFLNGFNVLKSLLLFLVNCWSAFLIMGLLFFGIRKLILYINKKAPVVVKPVQ